jgi:DNA modification methylase
MTTKHDIYLGDSREQLKLLAENSVDLIVTSPPYADQRKETMLYVAKKCLNCSHPFDILHTL